MLRLTLTSSCALAILVVASPARMCADGDTKITVKDGGSIVLILDGLDAGQTWKVKPSEIRHVMGTGMLTAVAITEAGADKCGGDATCGINTANKWTISVNYGGATFTIASVAGSKGVHVKFPKNGLYTAWKPTGNKDERDFDHGGAGKITGITVNNGPNLCAGKDGCAVTLHYKTP